MAGKHVGKHSASSGKTDRSEEYIRPELAYDGYEEYEEYDEYEGPEYGESPESRIGRASTVKRAAAARKPVKSKGRGKKLVLGIAVFLLLAALGAVLIYFFGPKEQPVQESKAVMEIACVIHDDFENDKKQNVCVENTGRMPIYVRVRLVPLWYDKTDDSVIAETAWVPQFEPEKGWVLGEDGLYYYTSPLAPGDKTTALIPLLEMGEGRSGRNRQALDILASCIQAEPEMAAVSSWSKDNGSVQGVSEGMLVIEQ